MINWGGRKYIPANTVRNNRQNISERDRLEDLLRPLGEKKYNTNTWIANVLKDPNVSPTPPPFDPSSLGDLQIWFDAADTDTLGLVGGNTVDTWTSKGLVDVVMSASTTARRPGYTTTGGEGTNPAVILYTASTAANRSGLLSVDNSKSVNLTTGYTYVIMGKNISSKPASGVYSNTSLLNMWNSISTNSYAGQLFFPNQRTVSDYLQTGATTGYIQGYSYYPGSSAFTNVTDYVLNSLVVDYTNLYPGQSFGKNIISGNTIQSSLSTSGLTSYTGKTLNGFGIASVKSTGTESSSVLTTFEVYEILLYNKTLSSSELNQVENYLRNKWQYSVNTNSVAVIESSYTGKTNQVSDYARFIYGSTTASQYVWNNINDRMVLPVGVTLTFDNSIITAGIGINYDLKDSLNNTILSQSCYDSTDKTIVLSAGTYSFTGNLDYSCVFPTPTPTMTPTFTPSPTPTFTPTPSFTPTPYYLWADNFFNLTGDSTSTFKLIQDSNSQVWFDIQGAITTGFTMFLPPESFTLEYSNTNGNYMNFEGYGANCSTGAPGSLLYSNYCTSVNNQNWGFSTVCYYFNMFADQASCP